MSMEQSNIVTSDGYLFADEKIKLKREESAVGCKINGSLEQHLKVPFGSGTTAFFHFGIFRFIYIHGGQSVSLTLAEQEP